MKRFVIFFLASLPILVAYVGALFIDSNRIETEVRNSVTAWEEDVARSLLLEKDANLLEKILRHALPAEVVLSEIEIKNLNLASAKSIEKLQQPSASCWHRFSVPVTLYGVPAAQLQFCEPVDEAILRGFLSPIFLGVVILSFAFFGFFRRETMRFLREKKRLQSKVILQEDLARVSRQVAHDIRGPLSALQMVLSLPERQDQSDEKNRILHSAVNRIRGISDDLFSQGKLSLDGSTTVGQLHRSFDRLALELQKRFEGQTLTWTANEIDSRTEIPLRDEVWERILQNLLQNACEANLHAHDRRVTVKVALSGSMLVCSVHDAGAGIPSAIWEKIGTEGFSYGKANGTGLGLAFVRRHLEAAGGQLSFVKSWNGGFEVRVACPILHVFLKEQECFVPYSQ